MRSLVAVSLLWIASAHDASATGVEPAKDLRIDPALCLAAALARDDDRTEQCLRRADRQRKDREARPHQGADGARGRL